MTSHEEDMNLLIHAIAEALAENIRKRVPVQGSFEKIAVRYRYPETEVRGLLMVEEDLLQQDNRRLTAAMFFLEDDRMISNYLMKGSNQEILDYLHSENGIHKMIETYEHLKTKLESVE